MAAALAEDLGERGDITSALLIPEDARLAARVVSRADGVLAGREAGEEVLRQTGVGGRWLLADGAAPGPGHGRSPRSRGRRGRCSAPSAPC